MENETCNNLKKEEQVTCMKSNELLLKSETPVLPKWKELLQKIVSADEYYVDSIVWKKDENDNLNGIVVFSIPLKVLGLTVNECRHVYNRELFSNFMMDFVGELFIRSNLEKFTEQVLAMDCKSYVNTVGSKSHEFFGASLNEKKNTFELSFFASLIQRIITEDFRLHVTYEKSDKS